MPSVSLTEARRIADAIHDKYKKDSRPPTGNQNCQLCTWCAEAQFRGIDVLPRPIYSPRDPALSSEIKGPTIVKSPTKIKIRNKDHIVSTVKDDPGSRYYTHVKWNGGPGGHEFLIINIDSNVYIMDAQQGLVESIDKTKYFDDVDYSGSYFARLDNKQLNRELLDKMNSMKTLVPWDWDKDVEYMKKHGMLGEDEDIRFIRYYVPSDKATEYLKKDPELKQYWEKLNRDTYGEILVDPDTKEQIGHGFVYNGNDKSNEGFIFNIEVMPKYRKQGFGTIILNDCVTKFGGRDLTVDCDNEPAVHMYLKYGFEIIDKGNYSDHGEGYYMRLKKSKTIQESTVSRTGGKSMGLTTKEREAIPKKDFGVPERDAFPLDKREHVISAAHLFGHAKESEKHALARKILARAKEYNIDTSGWEEVLKYAQEQVPPMSDGTSTGNQPPHTMAPYCEEDELLSRAKLIGKGLTTDAGV